MPDALFDMEPSVRSEARLSPDGLYRYTLSRTWTPMEPDAPERRIIFAMLNPSTADHWNDDPTIVRCTRFAQGWGYDGLDVVNLDAFRATDPKVMKAAADPIGPENDEVLRAAFKTAAMNHSPVVAAWGANADPLRAEFVAVLARAAGVTLLCLGVTKDGHPRHPLYVRADADLTPWKPR